MFFQSMIFRTSQGWDMLVPWRVDWTLGKCCYEADAWRVEEVQSWNLHRCRGYRACHCWQAQFTTRSLWVVGNFEPWNFDGICAVLLFWILFQTVSIFYWNAMKRMPILFFSSSMRWLPESLVLLSLHCGLSYSFAPSKRMPAHSTQFSLQERLLKYQPESSVMLVASWGCFGQFLGQWPVVFRDIVTLLCNHTS